MWNAGSTLARCGLVAELTRKGRTARASNDVVYKDCTVASQRRDGSDAALHRNARSYAATAEKRYLALALRIWCWYPSNSAARDGWASENTAAKTVQASSQESMSLTRRLLRGCVVRVNVPSDASPTVRTLASEMEVADDASRV